MPNVSEIANMFGNPQSNMQAGGAGKGVTRSWDKNSNNDSSSVPMWKQQLQQNKENQNHPTSGATRKPWEKPQDHGNSGPPKPWEKPQNHGNSDAPRKPWEKPQDHGNSGPPPKPWEKPQNHGNSDTPRKPWEKPQDQNNSGPPRKPWEKPQDQNNSGPPRKPWEKSQDQNDSGPPRKPWEKSQDQNNSGTARKPWEKPQPNDNVRDTNTKWNSTNIPPKPDIKTKPHIGNSFLHNSSNEDANESTMSKFGSLPRNKSSLSKNFPSWQKQNEEDNSSSAHSKSDGIGSLSRPPKNHSFLNKTNNEENTQSNGFERPEPVAPPAAPARDRPSFLHRKFPAGSGAQQRRRLPLPADIQSRSAPVKPRKPFNVKLPGKDASESPNHHQNTSLSSSPASTPPSRSESFLNKKHKEAETPRNLPNLPDLPAPPPPSLPDRLPPVPVASSIPPALPDRPPLPPPNFPEPPAAVTLRTLPPTPGDRNGSIISQQSGGDDIYTDTAEDVDLPPPPPVNHPPLIREESAEMIETWDDEAEGIYDETPDETGFSPPPVRLPPTHSPMHQKSDDAKLSKEEEKRKKEAHKKEKEMRKKFKLPKEGDIVAEATGIVKVEVKGSGKDLSVHAGERVEIIRTNDNPKSKWLIRNTEGTIGYVDSDKISINTDVLRSTMQGFGSRAGSFSQPPMIPTEDEEGLYDETPGDDVYEEL